MESECQALRLRNDTLSQQLGLAQQESLGAQQDKNSTISELRAELKMKAFELTTLGVTFEVGGAPIQSRVYLCISCLYRTVYCVLGAHGAAAPGGGGSGGHAPRDLRAQVSYSTMLYI